MRRLEHCNIVKLKYFFYSSGDKVSVKSGDSFFLPFSRLLFLFLLMFSLIGCSLSRNSDAIYRKWLKYVVENVSDSLRKGFASNRSDKHAIFIDHIKRKNVNSHVFLHIFSQQQQSTTDQTIRLIDCNANKMRNAIPFFWCKIEMELRHSANVCQHYHIHSLAAIHLIWVFCRTRYVLR